MHFEEVCGLAELNGEREHLPQANHNSIGRWFEEYSRELRRYIWRNQARVDDIDDLLHDVFVVALKKNTDYEDRGKARAYLYGIARNLLMANRRKRRPQNNVADEEITKLVECEAEKQLEKSERNSTLLRWLHVISREQRIVIQMRTDQGMSFKEISESLKLSLNTVLSHFHRGISKIRRLAKTRER